jgi:hypothetical protein
MLRIKLGHLFFSISCLSVAFARSPHRLPDPDCPVLIVKNEESDAEYEATSSHFEKRIFELFDREFFFQNLVPESIELLNKDLITRDIISADLEITLSEISQGKKKFTNFDIIQKRNFNFRRKCGLLILKHKNYPIVAKIFMENPQSFIEPGWKGFEPNFIFFLSGGIGRQLAGFTRVKNRQHVENVLKKSDYWGCRVTLPRKWFWLPSSNDWITVIGKHINHQDSIETKIPSVYVVIADFIQAKEDNRYIDIRNEEIMKLCNFLDMYIDPHENNFIVTHDESNGLHIYIIDTEHFPSMVGLEEKVNFKNHGEWFGFLALKCLKDAYFRTKKDRRLAQTKEYQFVMLDC